MAGTQKNPSTGRATATEERKLRAEARADEKLLADVYDQGLRDAKADARTSPKPRSSKRRRVRASVRSRRSLSKGAAAIAGPAAADIGSGLGLVGAVVGLLLLYLTLTNADTASGILSALRRGFDWLADPHASIPYRTN